MKTTVIIIALVSLLFACTNGPIGMDSIWQAMASKDIVTFEINQADNPSLSSDCSATIAGSVITVDLPTGTDLTGLVADFTNTGTSVSVDGVVQVSTVTANDFSGPVAYTVTAEDSSTKTFSVMASAGSVVPGLTVAAPELSVQNASFINSITVSIVSSTANAFISYTTDGTDPSISNGTQIANTAYVTMTATTTLKAVGCISGWADSEIVESVYTKVTPDRTVGGTIQDEIDAAANNDVIFIPGGTYTEDLTINKPLTLIGEGTYPAHQTTIRPVSVDTPAIRITSGGLSATERVVIDNLLLTGGIRDDSYDGSGIRIDVASFITIENVTAFGNEDYGIHVNAAGVVEDLIIDNCNLSNNGIHGLRIASIVVADRITISDCNFDGNISAGMVVYSEDVNSDITISDTTFSNNSPGLNTLGEMVFSGYNGDLTLSGITITSYLAESGIRISGDKDGSNVPYDAGVMTFSDITFNGVQAVAGSYPSAAFTLTRYDDVSDVSFSNIVINSTAPYGMFIGTVIGSTALDLGSVSFDGQFADADIYLGQHANSGSYAKATVNVDATQATFTGATDDAEIENRIFHNPDDSETGTVSWTTP